MKRLILGLLLIPVIGISQTDGSLNTETDSLLTNTAHQNNSKYFRRLFRNVISAKWNPTGHLTTTGSSGAATFSGGILNIPNYTPIITSLTTTGSSGASSISSGVLNIPQYQGSLSLTTTGSSGAATLIGTTLNIPNYTGGGGITNSAANNELMKSNGTNAVPSGIFSSTSGEINSLKVAGGGFTAMPTLFGVNSELEIANNSATMDTPLRISHYTSAPNVGVGVALDMATLTSTGVSKIGTKIGSISTNVGVGTEAFDFVVLCMSGGAAATEVFRIKANGDLITRAISFTTITTTGNWANFGSAAGYFKDSYGTTHLRGAFSISSTNFPGTGAATATSAIPNATTTGNYTVPVFRANGSYYVGSASISVSTTGQISVNGFITTASASTTGTVGANVTLSGTDNVQIYLDGITYF